MATTIAVPVAVLTDDVLLALVNATWEVAEQRDVDLDESELQFVEAAYTELGKRGRMIEADVAGVLYFTK